MELDELKKSWNALDAQLQKEPIADEQQIKELIANYKTNTRHSLGRLVFLQRFSLGIGAVGLAIILLIWLLLPTFGFDEHLQNKMARFLAFIPLRGMGGGYLDHSLHCTVLLGNGLLYAASWSTSRPIDMLHYLGCHSYLFHLQETHL